MSAPPPSTSSGSYGQILKSSSIIGGAKAVNYVCSMVRIKVVAMLLGPAGVGMVGLYYSAVNLVGTVSNLGISTGGGREVARDHAKGDTEAFARTVLVLRRASWGTGLLGWFLAAVLAWPLSHWIFGSGEYAWEIALLGVILFFKAIADGQSTVVAGMRRMGDLARIDILAVIIGSISAIALYAWLRQDGIVPVIIVAGAISLLCSWWISRRIHLEPVHLTWRETLGETRRFLGLGFAVVGSTVASSLAALAVQAEVVKQLGIEQNGIFQAAQSLSVIFAAFILSAMGADFLPRLSAAADDLPRLNRLVNEQTEVGVLLVLPGVLGTLMFAPWILTLFYSADFVSGATALGWLLIASFGRVVSWPMSYTLMARGESRLYFITEIVSNVFYLGISLVLLRWLGMLGVALAFPILYLAYTSAMLVLLRRRTGFHWSPAVWRLQIVALALVAATFAATSWLPGPAAIATGGFLTAFASVLGLRGITARLGTDHRLVKMICLIPLGRFACGVRSSI